MNIQNNKKTFSNVKLTTLIIAVGFVFFGQWYFGVFEPAKKLEAVDCSGGVFTTGNDTITCTGDVTFVSSFMDFDDGDDVVTIDGIVRGDFGNPYELNLDNIGDTVSTFILTNNGHSTDDGTEIFINNGTTTVEMTSYSSNHALIVFDTGSLSTKNFTNTGLMEASNTSDTVDYIVYSPGGGDFTFNNSGIIRNDFGDGHNSLVSFGEYYTSDTGKVDFTNSGTIGKSGSTATAVSVNEGAGTSDLLNTNTGILYGNVLLNSATSTMTNRGQINGNVTMGDSDDIFIQSLATGSVSGSINGGADTDTYCLEIPASGTTTHDGTIPGTLTLFENFCYTGGGVIDYTAASVPAGYGLTISSSTTFTADAAVTVDGDLEFDGANFRVSIDSDTPTTTSPLIADGDVTIAGGLTIADLGSSLANGQSYTLIEGASITGTFASVAYPVLPSGLFWEINYTDTSVVITVSDVAGSLSYTSSHNISTASSSEVVFSPSEDDVQVMVFNDDGTSLYVSGFDERDINEYTLSTPYDISTASLINNDVLSDWNNHADVILFNGDGSKVYIIAGSSAREYTLGTPYDISTGSLTASPSLGFVESALFNDTGEVAYLMASSGSIISYNLANSYDLTTATANGTVLDVSSQGSSNQSMVFNNNGTILYILGASDLEINEYILRVPYDISTATFRQEALDLSTHGDNPRALLFNNDGSELYISGYQYDVKSFELDSEYKESLDDNGSIDPGYSMSVILSVDAFQDSDNDDLLDVGSEVTINNVPAGLTPVVTLSNSDTVATLTFTGEATYHADANDVADLTFKFDDSAFSAFSAGNISNSGDTSPYSSGVGIDFSGNTLSGPITPTSEVTEEETSSSRSGGTRRRSGSSSSSLNTNGTSGSNGGSGNVQEILRLLTALGLYDGPIVGTTGGANGESNSNSNANQQKVSVIVDGELLTCPGFIEYVEFGDQGSEVSKIQSFLQKTNFFNFSVTGFFGPITENAVKAFQARYANEILAPWGLSSPTGQWYQSTRHKANEIIGCSENCVVLDNGTTVCD